ncbi:BZ3501_MvSof-1269-A2-R1_C54g00297 [Microbotryum saponariae]|nr:BZ3501_MvSof-1269-A2-R1_C54g00297 [Microbotryum saponariae]
MHHRGSSRVYRVLDEKNQLFAIKKVDISKNDAESRQSFANEISLLEKLRGKPQIIQLIDSEIGENKRHLLMVMEQGETDLNNLLNEHSGKKISMNFIRYIWEGMLEAVHVIHNENVVHTDLKPANFVLVKGRLKLIDFGISKTIANDTTNIGRDQQIGTANYMPPEALIDSGMGRDGKRLMKLGRAADVWSLGCILHQMVYGRTPFAHIRDIVKRSWRSRTPTTNGVDRGGIGDVGVCLKFDPKTRATIPELLEHPFLRKPAPPIREEDLHWLVQSVTKLVTGKQLDETDMPKVSDKLMRGLIGRARGRVYDRYNSPPPYRPPSSHTLPILQSLIQSTSFRICSLTRTLYLPIPHPRSPCRSPFPTPRLRAPPPNPDDPSVALQLEGPPNTEKYERIVARWIDAGRIGWDEEGCPVGNLRLGEGAGARGRGSRVVRKGGDANFREEDGNVEQDIVWSYGFFLAPQYHRQGIMAAALKCIIESYLLPVLKARHIRSCAFEDNWGSRRTQENADEEAPGRGS